MRRGLTSAGAVKMDVVIHGEVVSSGYQMAPSEMRRSQLASLARKAAAAANACALRYHGFGFGFSFVVDSFLVSISTISGSRRVSDQV